MFRLKSCLFLHPAVQLHVTESFRTHPSLNCAHLLNSVSWRFREQSQHGKNEGLCGNVYSVSQLKVKCTHLRVTIQPPPRSSLTSVNLCCSSGSLGIFTHCLVLKVCGCRCLPVVDVYSELLFRHYILCSCFTFGPITFLPPQKTKKTNKKKETKIWT